jgi:hypothetical protein
MVISLKEQDWPASLAWMADGFAEGTFQAYSQFQPEKGPPLSSPKGSPISIMTGVFTFDDRGWRVLQQISGQAGINVFSIKLPKLKRTARVLFSKPPFVRKETIQGGVRTRIVEIELAEHPQL